MVDFLATFNLEDDTPSAPAQQHCEDIEAVQLQLQALIAGKRTQTRAEHVSTKLELSPNTHVTLSLTPSENEALEGLNSVDPSLGGVRTNHVPRGDGDVYTRTVVLNEAIMHQPQNEPVLQRAIAKHLINALSAADDSNWAVREVSKDTAGWKFVYLCRDSLKHWNRQSKSQAKMLVAEYTLKDLDPTVLNRPAFDCRGSLTIVFSRSSRAVIVDYEHTPMHKTVAELREHFKKPPRVLGPGAQKLKLQKTPKQTDGNKTPKKQKTLKQKTPGEKKERKKRPREPGQEGVTPRKRKKSTTGAAAEGEAGQAGGGQDDGGAQSTQQTAWGINITPQEAQRRKENATKMLSEAGVDPETLSTEQFNIFANQSPDLQKESLAMLAKYGAERLRIVHPGSSKTAGSSPPATSVQHAQAGAAGPTTTTEELVPALNSGGRKRKTGSRKSAGVTETPVIPPVPPSATTPAETPTKMRKMAKSRVACYPCKNRKVKCPHERPTCAECSEAGLSCEYPPQKPRNSKKSAPTVVEDGDDEGQDAVDNQLQEETQGHEGSGLPFYNQMPVSDMLTANNDVNTQSLDNQPTSFFPSAPSLDLPQSVSQFSQQTITTPSGLVLPHGHIYNNTSSNTGSGLSLPQEPSKQTPTPVPQPTASSTSSKATKRSTRRAAHGSRKSLPTKSSTSNSQNDADPENGAGWSSVNNGVATNVAFTESPNLAQQSRASHMRISTKSPKQTIAQTASLQQQKNQRVHKSPKSVAASQAHARNSPFQPVAERSSSRQGHISGSAVTSAYPPSTMAGSNGQGNSTYEPYTRPSHNSQSNDQSERVAYEPFSAHSSSSSHPYAAYDYNQINPGAGSGGRGTATTIAGSQWVATQNDGRSQNESPVYTQAGYDQRPSARDTSNRYDGTTNTSAQRGGNQGRPVQNNSDYNYSQGQGQPHISNTQSNWYAGYSNSENRFDWKGLGTPWSGN